MAILLKEKGQLYLSKFLIGLFPYIITFNKGFSGSDNTRLLFKRNASKNGYILKNKIKRNILFGYYNHLLFFFACFWGPVKCILSLK